MTSKCNILAEVSRNKVNSAPKKTHITLGLIGSSLFQINPKWCEKYVDNNHIQVQWSPGKFAERAEKYLLLNLSLLSKKDTLSIYLKIVILRFYISLNPG